MENNKKVILEIDNLKKYFINSGNINKAVDGVSFNVHEGEVVGLIGESGSGKTTIGRSLLRLYDNYNGFVRLNGKIISGKKISKRRNKFLRRNMQMIFQDPHASLNGQKTIYSTLKEPLIVNGIMKDKLREIFSDWNKVIKMFKYTFSKKTKTLELENLNEFNKIATKFVQHWEQELNNITFDSKLNLEDNFNTYFAYLEEKQNMESETINAMYSNTTKLIEYYHQKQQEFRDNNLEYDEIEVNNQTKLFNEGLLKVKYSQKQLDAYYEIKQVKEEQSKYAKDIKDYKIINKNTFKNFYQEFKNEKELIKNNRLLSTDLEFYAYNLKIELLNKEAMKLLQKVHIQLRYLGFSQIKSFVNDLKQYILTFYSEKLNFPYQKHLAKRIKNEIEQSFNFNYDKYISFNTENIKEIQDDFAKYDNKLKQLHSILHQKDTPLITHQELENIKKNLQKAKDINAQAYQSYVEKNKSVIAQLDEEIKEVNVIYHGLRDKINYLSTKFKEVHANFLKYIQEASINSFYEDDKDIIVNAKEEKNKRKFAILNYSTIVTNKLETQKTFDIEYKYLLKDIHNINLLLGINEHFMQKVLKNKLPWLLNAFEWVYTNLYVRYHIKNLLYKTLIYKNLEQVGLLKQFAYRYPHEFSGGQRQRIVIARALITEPKIIVADEPIASLDISIQAQVVNLLKDLCKSKNIGLIFIAHDLSMIEYVADRVEIMHLGKIVESGKVVAIYDTPVHPYTKNLFKAIPKISNADEKFKNVSFELDYLEQQKFPNIPKTYQVEDDHFVYGTNEQVHEWTKIIKDIKTLKIETKDKLSFEDLEKNRKQNK
ncbi:ATP-binding cassette domain-containing protein [Mycoplasma miroungirhinis]|uniref:ATP-binding cassette domain-containing protein n=1 Tax=Mycoplasma miroungirhinis TaxID=754516 RepID=A0A6M4JCZ9_9MOLU|nr:ATP-binding cassette domain-containing protein [Mycoplasma miroungirhinis]QJR43949.1 ATP-binding cassette domain-containing protein [Mycoplasma miroungirhinis]